GKVCIPRDTVPRRKLLHRFLRQLAERNFLLLPAADLSIAIPGFAFQNLFAIAVKSMLLMLVVAFRCHNLTSFCPRREVISSPFAHYSFCYGHFWPIAGKYIFIPAHINSFHLVRWIT